MFAPLSFFVLPEIGRLEEKSFLMPLQEEEWLSRVHEYTPLNFKAVEGPLQRLDSYLVLRSFLVGYSLSAPDIAIWGALRGNRVVVSAIQKGTFINLTRWFRFLE
jgi:glutamyl-tRNA synthetase